MKQKKNLLRRTCGTMAVHHHLLETVPGFRERQFELEQATGLRLSLLAAARKVPAPATIPVVVHVVYNTLEENISVPQIRSQISVLNKDFRAKNQDKAKAPFVWKGFISDVRVKFALAKKDPSGKSTTGITRTRTDRTLFGFDDSVKSSLTGGVDPWPSDRYLNIWVCSLDGFLGYAQFPGGPPETDGVVILNTAFGTKGTAKAPFNKGRTATHEIGHWLNLRHIWADTEDCTSTDFIEDTPNAAGPNYGKPTFPSISCNNGPHGDMFMNYMDYVDDDAMFMFTAQQTERMWATLEGPRNKIGRP